MPVSRNEKWVQIAKLDENDQIHFNPSYLELMSELGWEAKAFAGHLLGLWYDPFEHMLDYSSGHWSQVKVAKHLSRDRLG